MAASLVEQPKRQPVCLLPFNGVVKEYGILVGLMDAHLFYWLRYRGYRERWETYQQWSSMLGVSSTSLTLKQATDALKSLYTVKRTVMKRSGRNLKGAYSFSMGGNMLDAKRGERFPFHLSMIPIAQGYCSGRGMLAFAAFLNRLGYTSAMSKSRTLKHRNRSMMARSLGVPRSTLDRYLGLVEDAGLAFATEDLIKLTPVGFELLVVPQLITLSRRMDSLSESIRQRVSAGASRNAQGDEMYLRLSNEAFYVMDTSAVYRDFDIRHLVAALEHHANELRMLSLGLDSGISTPHDVAL